MRVKLMNLAWLLVATRALAANPYAYAGKSWDDPPLRELLTQADLVAECRVIVGGQFRAMVEPVRIFFKREAGEAPTAITVEGFNSYEWNTAYYTMREGETMVLALFTPGGAGDTYTLATPSSGRFPVDKGRVLARLGKAEFLVEIPADDFRAALDAYFLENVKEAARTLSRMLSSDSLETRYLAIVLLGELPQRDRFLSTELLAPLARDRNPAIREAAARSLGRAGALRSTQDARVVGLSNGAGGPGAAKALATFLTDADHMVARAAARAVVETESPGAGRELVAWLSRVAVREEIDAEKEKEGEKGGAGAGGARQEDYRVQGEAFRFLAAGKWLKGASDDEKKAVTRGLVEMIASGEPGRARLAARVLGHLGVKEAVPGLIRLLDAESESLGADSHGLREEAGAALIAITLAPEAASRSRALEWWRRHKDEPQRKWVEQGLARAAAALRSGTYEGDTEGRLLVAVSRSPVAAWVVRSKLAEGTGWGGPEGAPFEYMKGPLVLPFAERALAVGTTSQRLGAAKALAGIIEDARHTSAIQPAMLLASYDTNSEVRAAVIPSLARMWERPRPIHARLLDLMEYGSRTSERKAAADALRKMAGRRFGFYVSRGYDLEEELRGLELWREWLRRQREIHIERRFNGSMSPPPPPWEEPERDLFDGAGTWLRALRHVACHNPPRCEDVARLARWEQASARAVFALGVGMRRCANHSAELAALLDDPEPFVRIQAAWALGNSLRGTGKPPRRLIEIAREALPEKAEAARASGASEADEGKAGLPPVVHGKDKADPWPGLGTERPRPQLKVLSAIAIGALGKIGGADSLDVLGEAARSGSPELQCEAASALAHFPGAGADELLYAAIMEGDSSARRIAARALAMRKPPGAAKAMARAIAPVDYWEGYILMDALAEVARPEDSRALAALLTPENETASIAAAYALTRAPGRDAAPGLVNALETCGSSTRYYVSRALVKLGEKLGEKGFPDSGLTAELRLRATKALVEELSGTESLYASYAAQALERVGVPWLPETADALFVYRRSWRPQDPRAMGAIVRLAGDRGISYAFKQLRDGTWSDKYYTLHALHYRPTREVVAKLVESWRDPESPFQAVAARSLRKCGMPAVEAVAELLGQENLEEDVGLRRRAVWLLGETGRETGDPGVAAAVMERLIPLVGDDDPSGVIPFLADCALGDMTGLGRSLDRNATPPGRVEAREAREAVERWRRLTGQGEDRTR